MEEGQQNKEQKMGGAKKLFLQAARVVCGVGIALGVGLVCLAAVGFQRGPSFSRDAYTVLGVGLSISLPSFIGYEWTKKKLFPHLYAKKKKCSNVPVFVSGNLLGIRMDVESGYRPEKITEKGYTGPQSIGVLVVENESGKDINFLNIEMAWRDATYVSGSSTNVYISGHHVSGSGAGGWRANWRPLSKMSLKNIKNGGSVREKAFELPFETTKESTFAVGYTQVYGEFSNGEQFHQKIRDIGIPEHHCFVLTAACGDENHPTVTAFRALRDEVLVNHQAGRKFADWYYAHGPKIAARIQDKPILKAVVRGALTPPARLIRAVRKNDRKLVA